MTRHYFPTTLISSFFLLLLGAPAFMTPLLSPSSISLCVTLVFPCTWFLAILVHAPHPCLIPLPIYLSAPFLACAHHPCPISVKGFTQNGRKDQARCPAFCPLYPRGPPVCFFLSLYTAVPLFLCLCPPLPWMDEPLLPCLSFMGPPGPDRCGGGGGDWRKSLTAEKLSD